MIRKDDIIKIKLGVTIDGCVSLLERSYQYINEMTLLPVVENVFIKCQKICEKNMYSGNTNDEVRKLLEIELLENGFQFLENVISYQTFPDHLNTSESKYMILNYQKYYDDNGLLLSNDCFEFLENEVYHVILKFIKKDSSLATKTTHNSHIFRFNEYFYNLKMKSARDFHNTIKQEHSSNAFVLSKYNKSVINKLGFKECFENGILEEYPIEYTVDNSPVYSFGFTIIISKKRGVIAK